MSLGFRERLDPTRPQAWIPDLIVTASGLGLGAGGAGVLRGCRSVTLESGDRRHLDRAVGMAGEGMCFRLHLQEGDVRG